MATMEVHVTTPEREVWVGEATMVVVRAVDGDVGILPGHMPLLTENTSVSDPDSGDAIVCPNVAAPGVAIRTDGSRCHPWMQRLNDRAQAASGVTLLLVGTKVCALKGTISSSRGS